MLSPRDIPPSYSTRFQGLVMISAMVDLNVEPYSGARKLAVFQRFLYLLVENHYHYLAEDSDLAAAALQRLLYSSESQDMESLSTSETLSGPSGISKGKDISGLNVTQAVYAEASQEMQSLCLPDIAATSSITFQSLNLTISIPVRSLSSTHLLPIDELDALSRLGPTFNFIKDNCSCTIATFLHVLATEVKVEEEPIDCFDRIMAREPLNEILDGKLYFSEMEVRGMIEEKNGGAGLPVRNKEQ
jgi:hypothetical protein